MKLLIFCVLSIVICEATSIHSDSKGRIIGGVPAAIHLYPYAAAIHVQTSNSKFFCGGTLYTNQYLITAGQCIDGAILFTIQLGASKLSDPDHLSVATSDYILHPDYDANTLINDIGLIKFYLPIRFTDSIASINYLAIDDIAGHQIRTIGWGQLDDQTSELSDELQYVYVTPLTNDVCKRIYGNQIADNMVCVEGNFNQGTCHGDTGGPLIDIYSQYHTVHVGVASFISGNGCETTDPSGYTRTLPYVDWIRNETQTTA